MDNRNPRNESTLAAICLISFALVLAFICASAFYNRGLKPGWQGVVAALVVIFLIVWPLSFDSLRRKGHSAFYSLTVAASLAIFVSMGCFFLGYAVLYAACGNLRNINK